MARTETSRPVTTRNAHDQPGETDTASASSSSTGDGVVGAALVGSLLGGLVGGAVLYALTPIHLAFIGSLIGAGGSTAGFGVWLGLAVVLGLLFASVAGPVISFYTSAMTRLTARSALLRKLVKSVFMRSPLGSTASIIGLLYGLIMGIVVGLVAIPAAVGANVPAANTTILAGYVVFGYVFGLGYGLTLEGSIPVPSFSFISPTARATVFAPLLAAGLSGAIVYSQQPLYLRFLGTLANNGTPTIGLGVWVGGLTLLGIIFALAARGHANRGNGTTGYGFAYGIVLAVFIGLLAVPAVVSATTQYDLGFGNVSAATLGAFALYGVVLGSVFGKIVNRRPLRPGFLVGRTRATVISALIAGGLAGAILYQAAPVYLLFLAEVVGAGGSFGAGFGVFLGIAVVLAIGFATLPARRVERKEYAGQTGFKLGAGFGILATIVMGMFVVPAIIASTTQYAPPTPYTNGPVLGTYFLFGILYGLVYGGIKAQGRVTPVFLQGRGVPLAGSIVVGGAVSAAVVYTLTPSTLYFLSLSYIAGVASYTVGIGIWFGFAVLFGLLFIPLAARTVEHRVGLPRGLGVGVVYGAVLTGIFGMFVVPAIVSSRGFPLSVPHTNPPVAGYLVFGIVFGGVYGLLRKRTLVTEDIPTSTAIGTRGQRAMVFGSLFGGSVGGLIVYHMVGPVAMRYFGALVGYGGSAAIGWGVWLGLSLILGLMFAVAVGPRLDGYVRSMGEFAGRDEDVDAVLGDFLDRAPVTTTATFAGFVYGIILAVAVGAIAVPLAVNTMTGPNIGMSTPVLQPYFLLAFVIYGLIMGMGYGVVKEF